MKPFVGGDISLSAGAFSDEYPDFAELVTDAYWLRMKGDVRIVFVPRLPAAVEQLAMPADVDAPVDRDEALSRILLTARYAVVVDERQAGLDGVVRPAERNDGAEVALFFVGADEYRALVGDLERLCDESGGMWVSGCLLSNFGGAHLVEFLRRRVVPSPALSEYARTILQAEGDDQA